MTTVAAQLSIRGVARPNSASIGCQVGGTLATSAALDFTRDGQLRVIEGEVEGPSMLGARLLELLRLAPVRARPDLAFGREVARRVLAAIAARGVAYEEALVTPAQGELGELLAAASAIVGRPP